MIVRSSSDGYSGVMDGFGEVWWHIEISYSAEDFLLSFQWT